MKKNHWTLSEEWNSTKEKIIEYSSKFTALISKSNPLMYNHHLAIELEYLVQNESIWTIDLEKNKVGIPQLVIHYSGVLDDILGFEDFIKTISPEEQEFMARANAKKYIDGMAKNVFYVLKTILCSDFCVDLAQDLGLSLAYYKQQLNYRGYLARMDEKSFNQKDVLKHIGFIDKVARGEARELTMQEIADQGRSFLRFDMLNVYDLATLKKIYDSLDVSNVLIAYSVGKDRMEIITWQPSMDEFEYTSIPIFIENYIAKKEDNLKFSTRDEFFKFLKKTKVPTFKNLFIQLSVTDEK